MRVVQVAPQVPYPLTDGGKVGIYNITRHLAERGHEITFVGFDRNSGTDYSEFSRYCKLVPVSHSTETTVAGMLGNLFSPAPYTISKYDAASFWAALDGVLAAGGTDIVHVDHLHMARYGLRARATYGIPILLREHNVESTILERFRDTARNPIVRGYLALQAQRLREYEADVVAKYDRVCPITGDDADRLRRMSPESRLSVVPGGVESSYFDARAAAEPIPDSAVFVGSLDWIPNRDAVIWFIDRILPRVARARPRTVFHIIGKMVPASIRKRQSERCVIRGFVPDLPGEMKKFSVSIAPFRIGGGIRLKILESFAMRVPVVSTSVGCEGIGAVAGKQILIGDDEETFAAALIRLFDDPSLRTAIAESAWTLADANYRWQHVAERFERIYHEVVHAAPGRVG